MAAVVSSAGRMRVSARGSGVRPVRRTRRVCAGPLRRRPFYTLAAGSEGPVCKSELCIGASCRGVRNGPER